MTRSEYIDWLANAIVEQSRRELAGKSLDYKLSHTYYILNIQHHAIYGMYSNMKAKKAMHPQDPPGDAERLRWELGLLTNAALMEIGKYYTDGKKVFPK